MPTKTKQLSKPKQPLPPVRVRREPPTVEEAVAAAQSLTSDVEQQVEVAAGLIGLPADEVRPHVLNAPPPPPETPRRDHGPARRAPPTVVVVQRRSRAPVSGLRPAEGSYRPLRRG